MGIVFFEVEQSGEVDRSGNDSKVSSSKLTIGAEIGIPGLVKAHVEWVKEKTKDALCDGAKIGSSGDGAQIGSSGRYAKIGSSGDDAQIICEADHAVVVCAGRWGKCKAPLGTWVTLAEYGEYDGDGFPCSCVKSFKIDGDKFKPNTWYTLKGGEVIEVEDCQ